MAKKKETPEPKVHVCIQVDGQVVCIDTWPPEARALVAARAGARLVPVLFPGYEAQVKPEYDAMDLRAYITDECIVRFPWMEEQKK